MYRKFGKRVFDIGAALAALILLTPLMVALLLLVRLKLGSPIFFSQKRPGLGGRPFILHKFRTMTDSRDRRGQLMPDSERLTRFGNFLRASSLDELPELFNVLKGEMSLVGPRPLLMEYLARYSVEQARRHEAKPGITGWAQINGRNAINWEERFKLDVWYVDRVGFLLDLKIIFMTLAKIVRREGISADGHPTMPVFMGSPQGKDR